MQTKAAKLSVLGTFKHLAAGSTVTDKILKMRSMLGEKRAVPLSYSGKWVMYKLCQPKLYA